MNYDRQSLGFKRWTARIANTAMEDIKVYDERRGRTIPLDEVEAPVPGGFRAHSGWQLLREAR